MLLYHGSKNKLTRLEKRQASSPHTEVPEGELLDTIYFTPDYGFAVACAARPKGVTQIDSEKKTIRFENPDLFDPSQDIFIYTINSENIPSENIQKIDDHQYAIDVEELRADLIEHKKAEEVMKYFELINWKRKESSETSNENKFKFK